LVCVAFVKSFLGASLHLSEMDRYIRSHNYIKTFNWYEALLRYQCYRFIVKWIALLNNRLSCKVNSWVVWLNFEWMSRQWNQISPWRDSLSNDSLSNRQFIECCVDRQQAFQTRTPTSSFDRVTRHNRYDSANAGRSQRAL